MKPDLRHLIVAALSCTLLTGTASGLVQPDDESWPVNPTVNPEDKDDPTVPEPDNSPNRGTGGGDPTSSPDPETETVTELVETELVLSVDVSGSVDPAEYELQLEGYIEAFRDPALHQVVSSGDGVGVTFLRWSSTTQQTMTKWYVLRTADDCLEFASTIEDKLLTRPYANNTNLSQAVRRAILAFDRNNIEGRYKVVDVSGDGVCNNWWYFTEGGENPTGEGLTHNNEYGWSWQSTRELAAESNVVINGISIGDTEGLSDWYAEHVPSGDNSFTLHAEDFEQFKTAIKLKLLMELQSFLRTSHD